MNASLPWEHKGQVALFIFSAYFFSSLDRSLLEDASKGRNRRKGEERQRKERNKNPGRRKRKGKG